MYRGKQQDREKYRNIDSETKERSALRGRETYRETGETEALWNREMKKGLK